MRFSKNQVGKVKVNHVPAGSEQVSHEASENKSITKLCLAEKSQWLSTMKVLV